MALMGIGIEDADFDCGSPNDWADYIIISKDGAQQTDKLLKFASEYIDKQQQLIDTLIVVAEGVRPESDSVATIWNPVLEEIQKRKAELDEMAGKLLQEFGMILNGPKLAG